MGFDITAGKRRDAVYLGAIEITYGEGGHLARAKRAGVRFNLDQLRTDPAAFQASLQAEQRIERDSVMGNGDRQ